MSERLTNAEHSASLMPNAEQRARLRKVRKFKDHLSRYGVASAGMLVVAALALIFLYLFSEVAPLLKGAEIDVTETYQLTQPQPHDPIEHLVLERYEEIGATFHRSGRVQFFAADTGAPLDHFMVSKPQDAEFSALGVSTPVKGLAVYGFDNGAITLIEQVYELSYPNGQRLITPSIEYPLGEEPLQLDEQGRPLRALTVQPGPAGPLVATITEDNRILLAAYKVSQSLFGGAGKVNASHYQLPALPDGAQGTHILVDGEGRHIVVADDQARLHYYDISERENIRLLDTKATKRGQITQLKFLVGTYSFVFGTDTGAVSQWFLVRDDQNRFHLTPVRDFDAMPASVTKIAQEYTRKGFAVGDSEGNVGLFYGTSAQTLLIEPIVGRSVQNLALSPINSRLLALDVNNQMTVANVWNKHPEISFGALWEKVWYEGRQQPEYIWQSSGGQDEFEPKMSLVPLTVGTLKAAFYAMLFAMPLGIMGAIYTAYFMTPKLRGVVKPSIEIMEALPTVILGFLAGLWLAPYLENHLPAIFSILIFLPILMLLVGFAWSRLPASIRNAVPEGWEAAILVLPIILLGWACVEASPIVEVLFFDGSARQWLTNQGITYDQRNALVVGIAMGFAVIPTIFSIAEDAVFNVPKHLTQGSLALGATRWQTVMGVVIPTASPGIFSAVMMGFGRAVGETMIVLMATGNSPVVNFNIFEGMRTLSANIAVELPETAINSTHFRVLFLAALVLLAMTFVVNTIAEIVRQRLRKRYSNL